ncbi:MAG: mandelate racemase/muconate lactonizing enzyme family protein [Thermoguttaceae bacterium]|nr:mandelate racemase/muconate lactonizing enzyme family protein [Thermoguttaceae bacterium]
MNTHRRGFLKSAALGTAGALLAAPALGDAPETTKPFAWQPVEERLKNLRTKTGLKIVRIETFTRGTNLSVVRVTADDGSEGFGQISPFDADLSAQVLHRKIAPCVLGADPGDFEAIADRCIEANYKFPWSFVCRALTGVDTAIWDLLGKRAKASVCALLGGAPRPIAVYGSSMSRSIRPADEAARLARLRDEKGFTAFKVRVGKVCGHDQDEWPGRTEALIPTVRKALGDRVALLADGNSCYRPAKAIAVGRLLEDHGYCHFEEPCPYWELEWTAEVAAALRIAVAGGEQDNDLAQWRRMIRMRAVDIVQPDVCYVGGLTRALRVAAMAAEAGLSCVPHSANLSLVAVFTLHLLAAIPNAGPHMEFTIESGDWWKDLYSPALEVHDGRVAVPEGPGWGVTIHPTWLAKADRQVSNWRS